MSTDQQPDDLPGSGQIAEKPEVTEEHKERAREIAEAYEDDDRPTIMMPGTDGAVSGTAVNDWIDDDGNPKYAKTDES